MRPRNVWQSVVILLVAGSLKSEGGCKVLNFLVCQKNKIFTRHVVKSFRILAPGLEDCQHKCYQEDNCVSYNLGPVEGMITSCELNEADHVTRAGHVVSKNGSKYCPIKHLCTSKSCLVNEVCVPDFAMDSFNCRGATWTTWSTWSNCSCGKANRTRSCVIQSTSIKSNSCTGAEEETKTCILGKEYPAIQTDKTTTCVFPFIYNGMCYDQCTMDDWNRPWCATTSNYDKDRQWGNCLP